MKHRLAIVAITLLQTFALSVATAADPSATVLDDQFNRTVRPFVQTYCVTCHSGQNAKGEFDLSIYSTMALVVRDQQRWNIVLEQISGGDMPPTQAKAHPTSELRNEVIAWIKAMKKNEADRNAGDPGIVLARRLSNAEYDYTIRDLTGVDIKPTKEFPVDPANEAGFDNSGESLAMSPALVKKYLQAARLVSEHVLFQPKGFSFAPYPVVTDEDRDKYAVHKVVDFYYKQPLDYATYFQAAWRFQNRAALGKPDATLADFAKDAKVSAKYLAKVWDVLNASGEEAGPIAVIQSHWRKMPAPQDEKEPEEVRSESVRIRDFIVELRPFVAKDFSNLSAREIAAGSQILVLWKNRQFAENRMTYAGNAQQMDMSFYARREPLMLIPAADDAKARYEESFKRFCAVFPDWFYISYRARSYLTNQAEITRDLQGQRLLTAGFHSQMGYFRDDTPLYELVLDESQQRELDDLWKELDFITLCPTRMHRQFLWYERAESSFMLERQFDFARPEGDDTTSEANIKQLADLYLAKAKRVQNSERVIQAIEEHFQRANTNIRVLEKARLDAEPTHLDSLLAFAERAFRRPLLATEREGLLAFYRTLRGQKLDHEEAIRDCVVSVLMSPYFCYRIDLPSGSQSIASGVQPLSDYELASRLSYFLWSSMPDQELLSHAAAGDLHRPEVLVAQARRMMKDQRIDGFAREFGGNWLDIRRFEEHNAVDRDRFPSFTSELREAMFQEPIQFINDLIRRNGSVLDFVYGDYTFVNPVLAKHYGMPVSDDSTDKWVRVDDAKKYERGGLLPMSVFLTKNAPGLRTSPVKRGYWVVTRLLGEHIPAPPPNVPVLPTDETQLGDLTLPQTLARHRADPACASCHDKFDSFGLVFEGFGPIGEVRSNDLAGRPVQTKAVFPDGSEGTGLAGLHTYLRTRVQDEFLDNLSRKLAVYALGRSLLASDDSVLADMRQKLSSDQYRFDGLVETIVTSKQFLTRRGGADVTKE